MMGENEILTLREKSRLGFRVRGEGEWKKGGGWSLSVKESLDCEIFRFEEPQPSNSSQIIGCASQAPLLLSSCFFPLTKIKKKTPRINAA